MNEDYLFAGPFLIKASRHQSKDCEVCDNQIAKDSKINQETSFVENQTKNNKIVRKYTFLEVIHEGLSCHACKMKPIKGNKYLCLACSDLNFCESCGESVTHDHPLLFTSSK